MLIYLVCFASSAFFAFLAQKAKNKFLFVFLSIVSILITTILAGLRDVSIGIDTKNYYYGSWLRAMNSTSLSDFFRRYFLFSNDRTEVLSILLIGVTARLTGDFQMFLFLEHLIIISCLYIGAFRLQKHADPVFVLLCFYFLYYNHSLNITRQYISMAILFAAFADLEKRKYLRYLIFTLVAFLFHNTGILGLLPFIVYRVLYPSKWMKNVSLIRKMLVISAILSLFVLFVPAVRLLVEWGFLSRHYLVYLSDEEHAIPKIVILLLVAEAAMIFFFRRGFIRSDEKGDFYVFSSVAFLVLYQLALTISYGKRIASYFSMSNIITMGGIYKNRRLPFNRRFLHILILTAVVVYWLFFYVYKNSSQTIPYVLGI